MNPIQEQTVVLTQGSWADAEFPNSNRGTSLAVQWLRLCTSTAGDAGLIPGQGTKIPQAVRDGTAKKKKKFESSLSTA